ncbi:MAG: DUF1570 domain-containing protein [Phycisphaeraceae bacterium]
MLLLTSAALAESASEADDAQAREALRRAQNVRWTQQVLDTHFQGSRFQLETTDHFVIVHDTDARRARLRARLLEQTHERFYDAFDSFASLNSPTKPLVCVLFADRNDFSRYAQQVDWLDMSWSGGYYSSRTNRMALYDAQPRQAQERTAPADAHDHDTTERKQPRSNEPASASDDHTASDSVNRASASPPLNLASTTHEAAHQLAFNSGLQQRRVMYPFWLSEGLACAFETNHADESFGLGQLNPTRLSDLRAAMQNGGLVPLNEFVTMTRPPTGDPQRLNAVYAQAWALFRFLYLHDRDKLATYLRRLAHTPHGSRPAGALRREFVETFGPIRALEKRWQVHLKTLR